MPCFEHEGIINTEDFKQALDIVSDLPLDPHSFEFLFWTLCEYEEESGEKFFTLLAFMLKKIIETDSDDLHLQYMITKFILDWQTGVGKKL